MPRTRRKPTSRRQLLEEAQPCWLARRRPARLRPKNQPTGGDRGCKTAVAAIAEANLWPARR